MQLRRCLPRPYFPVISLISITLLLLAGCSGSNTATAGNNTASSSSKSTPASKQVLTFPNVGTTDIGFLDPAQGPDANSLLAVNMLFSGLVRSDINLNIVPDQATWQISPDGKTYTFTLKPDISFSDGTHVTAQTYIYTWTRALLPATNSPVANFFEGAIAGANDVSSGKARTLAGVKALDDHTLQVSLIKPTPYFLEELANPIFFPLNQQVIEQYGTKNWTQHAAGAAIGTGPWMIKDWDHNVKMVLVPNPHYYGAKSKLTEINMTFVNDKSTAFKAYRAGQYDFVWNLDASDQPAAKSMPGFIRKPLLQTDLLFFDNTKPPFNNTAMRQAFAYATDRNTLVHSIFKDTVMPAPTIIPPGMPGYQPNYAGLPYNPSKAKALLLSVYPDVTKVPTITFSYPSSQVSPDEASALQQMWQSALGIQVKMRSVELTAYNDETLKHQVQFGFTQWGADFPDPFDWLALNLSSTAPNNNGEWHNQDFDKLIAQAEKETGDARLALYNQAEQIAISDVGWLPIDHQAIAAVIPTWVHGVTLNGNGLYFGDWSEVYLLQR
ncbi:peptide ABC transporter substrate-binding protein [Ktedonosporobacter rubrisoli]|uniref:Peptide ABC transporter substrate-binding protein n=2 Tax=Ktedonosporobacter rubrisoli TaxID=2509675 RepID=A0A4P6K6I4_KTERU|nr:peptide ABC transporter substrate-binding protein [Ktedonosporobacter rubrisoli]